MKKLRPRTKMAVLKHFVSATQRGFTIMEVIIAFAILLVGVLAIFSLQISSINAFYSARETTQAAELARRIVDVMQIEAAQWDTVTNISAITTPSFQIAGPVFDTGAVTGMAIQEIEAAGVWTWVSLFNNPVDVRMARNDGVVVDMVGARFCAFARGAYLPTAIGAVQDGGGVTIGGPIYQVQLAIVYAAPRGVLTSCTDFFTNHVQTALIDDPTNLEPLELLGFRIAYFGTNLFQRN